MSVPIGDDAEGVIGVLLANDRHEAILVDGRPVTALAQVTTTK